MTTCGEERSRSFRDVFSCNSKKIDEWVIALTKYIKLDARFQAVLRNAGLYTALASA
jgi:hypothetical protein